VVRVYAEGIQRGKSLNFLPRKVKFTLRSGPTVQRQTKKKREHHRCGPGLKNGAAGPWAESLVHVGKSKRII
jgi:hypothetical protein